MREGERLRAIIYLRRLDDSAACIAWCEARGYRIDGVVLDPAGGRYHACIRAALDGQCDVIVIRSLADLPPDRLPRTEVADAPLEQVDPRPRRRRPRPRHL